MPEIEPEPRTAGLGSEQEATRCTERDDGHQCVVARSAADGVPVPGDAVVTGSVQADPGGAERDTLLRVDPDSVSLTPSRAGSGRVSPSP